jgi:hypothetical protein
MTDESELYSFCDFPELPSWLVAEIKKSVELGFNFGKNLQFDRRPMTKAEDQGFKRGIFEIAGTGHQRAVYRRYNLSQEAANWVRENIGEYSEVGSQLMRNGSAFTPHTDGGPRRYILNYLLDAGGPAVETQWFCEKGQDLNRDGPPMQFPDSSKLELVKTTIAPEKSWMMLYGKVIHAVVGITNKRIQLSISFSAEEFKQLKDKHNITLKYYG